MSNSTPATLYLVATPIGNLSDISERAIKTLRDVCFIAAEDTRITRNLLEHFGIKKPLISYYKHNSRSSGEKIVLRILDGESCALVTDAGTPGISDPGEDLVRLCVDNDIHVVVIPGACAVVAALSLSGLSAKRFAFEGFLPIEKKKRSQQLSELQAEQRTMVFYEAPHKLVRTLTDMLKAFGDRRVSISREMTKIYEETLRMTLSESIVHFESVSPRGEFVIVVEGNCIQSTPDDKLSEGVVVATDLIEKGLSVRDAVKRAAGEVGCSRNSLYKMLTINNC
ncbi:MAG: 16S rRNA (cytidine(1402)-2'-O)-methyltransferase [Oscillospiraceae bacterium]|nr:16S rRNA (cytidine(1402)-2'-O)-methyltransferase [Oscillospiraceae bacterium]